MHAALKRATTSLAAKEAKPDPLKQAPALERKVAKALALHHGALTAQIEAVTTQWALLQQQVVAEMSWRELDMQVGVVVVGLGLMVAWLVGFGGLWRALQQQVAADMSWRELDMQVGANVVLGAGCGKPASHDVLAAVPFVSS